MTELFIPFTSKNGSGKNDEVFRVKVLPNGKQGSVPFCSISPGADCGINANLEIGNVQESRVSMDREGDQISIIRFRCSCGELVELECVY